MSTEVESGNTQTPAAPVQDASVKPAEAQTQEQKPAEQKPADQKTDEQKPAEAEVKYTEFKMPDGVKVPEAVLGKFTEVFQGLKLPQDVAQKVMDELAPLVAKENAEAYKAILAEARKGWAEASKVDKELGGEKHEQNLALAHQTFEKFGTPALKELLETSGLGDHPEVIRWSYKVAQALGEDKVIVGRLSDGVEKKDPASILYDATKAA